jgi:hypothetical protein
MDEQDVIDTQAAMYMADNAIKAKLADRIGNHVGTLRDLVSRTGKSGYRATTKGKTNMSDKQKENNENTLSQADVDKAKAEGTNAGKALGVNDERARIKAITGSDEAKGREDLANHLAFDTSMSADEAVKLLSKSPKVEEKKEEKKEAAKGELGKHMDATNKPEVGADPPAEGEDTAESVAKRIAAHANGPSK